LVPRQARRHGTARLGIVHLLLLETAEADWRFSEEGRATCWQG